MKIGLCIPIGERGLQREITPYREMREFAVTADEGGLDSIWVADHILIVGEEGEPHGAWESLTMLAALAEATTRVEFGPLVLCTPFRNPGLIAWEANALEEISGGRLVLGLGAGWHQPEFDAFGFEFDHKVSVFEDSLGVVVPLLREGRVDYQGNWASGNAELRPRQARKGGPPILIAGSRPRMMSLIARWADRWNSVWYGLPTDEFRKERSDLVAACEAAGRDPKTIEVSAGIAIKDPTTLDASDGKGVVGRAEEIAEAFRTWQAEGVDEIMCRLEPPSVGIVEEIVKAAEMFRAGQRTEARAS